MPKGWPVTVPKKLQIEFRVRLRVDWETARAIQEYSSKEHGFTGSFAQGCSTLIDYAVQRMKEDYCAGRYAATGAGEGPCTRRGAEADHLRQVTPHRIGLTGTGNDHVWALDRTRLPDHF